MFKNNFVTTFGCTLVVERIKLLNLLGFTQHKDGHSLKGIGLQGEEDLRIENPI